MIYELKVIIKTVHEGVTKKLLLYEISSTIFHLLQPQKHSWNYHKKCFTSEAKLHSSFQLPNASNPIPKWFMSWKLWSKPCTDALLKSCCFLKFPTRFSSFFTPKTSMKSSPKIFYGFKFSHEYTYINHYLYSYNHGSIYYINP